MKYRLTTWGTRLHGRAGLAVICLLLSACLPEEFAAPGPVRPTLPSLMCRPFIINGYTEKVSYLPGEKMRVYYESKDASDLCRLTIFSITGDSVFSTASLVPLSPDIPADGYENGFAFPVGLE